MGSASGQGEIFGNDFMVTLGAWPSETGLPVGKVNDQIGTFLHELGHNFGLDHGGGNPLPVDARIENYKPNYLSVMNYSFQVSGIKRTGVPSPRFDFSRTRLLPLNENALNEVVGIQGSPDRTRFFCPQSFVMKSVSVPVPLTGIARTLSMRTLYRTSMGIERSRQSHYGTP